MDDACFKALHKVGALENIKVGTHLSETVGTVNKPRSRQKK
jgi:hypothetical protein